jgi:hypothetical protein
LRDILSFALRNAHFLSLSAHCLYTKSTGTVSSSYTDSPADRMWLAILSPVGFAVAKSR